MLARAASVCGRASLANGRNAVHETPALWARHLLQRAPVGLTVKKSAALATTASRSASSRVLSSAQKAATGTRQGGAWLTPRRGFSSGRGLAPPQAVYSLIGTNLLVYGMWQTYDSRWMMANFTLSEDGLRRRGRWWTAVTHFFSHHGMWHLASNMIGLYVFGPIVAGALGTGAFLSFYGAAGVVSGMGSLAFEAATRAYTAPPGWAYSPTVLLGASGAVYGVVAYGIAMNPTARLYLYGVLPVPAWLLGVGLTGMSVYGMLQHSPSDNVGHSAHLAGAVMGAGAYLATRGRIRRFR